MYIIIEYNQIMNKKFIPYLAFFVTTLVITVFGVSPLAAQDSSAAKTTVLFNPGPHDLASQNPVKVQSSNSQFANIQIVNNSTQNETSIAIDPVNPLKAICSANDFGCGTGGIRYFYTTDGGSTWGNNCIALPPNDNGWNQPFDPSVAYDSKGNAFICFGDYRSVSQGTAQNCIYVTQSTDGGITFNLPALVYADSQDAVSGSGGSQPFEDKMFIGCDTYSNSQYRDRLYVSWTHFVNGAGGEIYLSYSSDHGATWSTPASNGISAGAPGPQGSVPVAGPDGTMYVAWSENGFAKTPSIQITRSLDGGASFLGVQSVDSLITGEGTYDKTFGRMELTAKDDMRIATFPVVAIDNSNSPRRGTIYAAWQGMSQSDGSAHVFLTSSSNKGQSWSSPVIVDQGNSGEDVFFPAIACDQTNGNISIDYYDSRNSPNFDNSSIDLYCSISKDGGATFNEFRVSDTTTHVVTLGQGSSGGFYFGDYQGIAAYGGLTLPCWWDQRDGPGYFSCHIFTAIIRVGPESASSLQATTTCAIQNPSVVLTWTNPTTTTTGDPIGNYTVIVYRDGDSLATLPQGTTTYTDQTGISGTSYTYSIVISSSTGNSGAATVTIAPGGVLQTNPVSGFSLHPVTGGIRADWTNPSQHTDGTAACDLNAIYFYSDSSSTPFDSALTSNAGAGGSYTMQLDTTKIWHVYARVETKRGTAYGLSDTSAHFASYAGAPKQNLNENFDPPVPLLYTTGTWGTTSKASVSQPNSLTDSPNGNYASRQSTFCQLPPFVRNTADSTLTFYHILFSGNSTTADVDLTTDNGVTWRTMREYIQASHSAQWHDSVAASQWVEEEIALNPYCKSGDTASIRFRLNTGFARADGWYIDNVAVDSAIPNYVRISDEQPAEFFLAQNYPNPFSPSTSIQFMLPVSGTAHMDVYNSLGEKVASLIDGAVSAGSYAVNFDGTNLQPGVYFYSLRVGQFVSMKRMVLIK